MKRRVSTLFGIILWFVATGLPINAQIHNAKIDRAVVTFNEPVTLQGTVLHGRYLFLHHDGMMAKHRACVYVYTLAPEKEGQLIQSFHCIAITRELAAEFKVVTKATPRGLPEIIEVQFARTTQGHRVPEADEHP
jgi:hypothetical protein